MEQINCQRGLQVGRMAWTEVPEQSPAAAGGRGRTRRGVGQPRGASVFGHDCGGSERGTRRQETENSDWTAEKMKLSQEIKTGKQEEGLERLQRKEELERRRREELKEQELEKQEREELERQRREEEAEYNKLLEQEIREWETHQQEREAELEKQKREEQLEIQKREAELKRQKQEVEQKKLTIEKEKFSQQELLRQAREQELQRQKREKELEEEGRQLKLEKQRREAEKLERPRKEEEKLERQRREEEEKQRREELQKQLEEERGLCDIEGFIAEFKTFKGDFIGKKQTLPDHVKALYEVADAIEDDHRAATLAGCAGAGLSVAGGLVAISGAVLAPFTGGASLVATMGVGGSFLGSITRIAGRVKEKLDNTKREKTLDEILSSCQQMLQKFEDDYCQLKEKFKELEKRELKDNYRKALERIKDSFLAFEPALMTEIFKGTLKSISQLTGRLLSRMVMEKVSQEVSHVATTEAAKEVTKRMTKEATSYISYEAIKEFLTISSKEVSKKWYKDVATKEATSYLSSEAIKEFLTISSKEVSKKWYQEVARTSAVASGVASAIFMPFDAKDLYKDATHLKEGAKSAIAEEIRNAARQLELLIDSLNKLLLLEHNL